MVLVGSSEVSGSWKIIAMSLPRIRRSSSSLRPTSSRSFSLTEPLTIDPPGGSSPMIDKPVMDLPQPDSPTTPRVSPASMCRSTLPTACTTELVSLMWVDRFWMSRTGAIWPYLSFMVASVIIAPHGGQPLPASEPDVHRVTQRVADEVESHHGQDDAGSDRVDQPPGSGASRSRRQDKITFSLRQHFTPDQPGRDLPGEETDDQAQRQHRRAELNRQDQDHEQERNGKKHVDHAHHGRVDDAAGQPRDGTPQRADHDRDERGEEADLQCGVAALHEPAELVEPQVVGAEQVRP